MAIRSKWSHSSAAGEMKPQMNADEHYETMQTALDASGAEVITVAVRRERLIDSEGKSLLDFIDTGRYTILPNTAGCFDADDAVRVARLGRELLDQLDNPGKDWVKLEVLGDKKTLLPDPVGTLEATKTTRRGRVQRAGLHQRRPDHAPKIKDAAAAAVMPAGSPIGSGQGVLNPNNIRIILELLKDDDPGLPGDRRRGRGHRERRIHRDGARRRRRAAQHRHRHAKEPVMMAHAMRTPASPGGRATCPAASPRSSTPPLRALPVRRCEEGAFLPTARIAGRALRARRSGRQASARPTQQ
jgi:thiazole synthase